MVDLHKESYSTALLRGQGKEWDKSFFENRKCLNFLKAQIDEKISEDEKVPKSCVEETVEKFGFDRTMWVIANTVMLSKPGERDRIWARNFGVEYGDENLDIGCYSSVVKQLCKHVRELFDNQDLYSRANISDDGNYEGKILMIKPSALKEKYRTRENQLFCATSGFGCDPTKIGRKVFGHFLADGEAASFQRVDFIGVIKPELVPDWAQANLKKIIAGEPIEIARQSNEELNM